MFFFAQKLNKCSTLIFTLNIFVVVYGTEVF